MLGYVNSRLAVKIANDVANGKTKKNKTRGNGRCSSAASTTSSIAASKTVVTTTTASSSGSSSKMRQAPISPRKGRKTVQVPSLNSDNTTVASGSVSSSAAWPAPRPSATRPRTGNKAKTLKKPAPRPSARAPKKLVSCMDKNELSLQDNATPNSVAAATLKNTSNDATSTTSIPKSIQMMNLVVVKKNPEEEQAQAALTQIQRALDIVTKQQTHAQANFALHFDRAASRLDSNNQVGALLSIKRTYKLQTALASLGQTVALLQTQHDELEQQLEEYRLVCDLVNHHDSLSTVGSSVFDADDDQEQEDEHRAPHRASTSPTPPELHLKLQPSLMEKVDRILLEANTANTPASGSGNCDLSEEELLAWFRRQQDQQQQ